MRLFTTLFSLVTLFTFSPTAEALRADCYTIHSPDETAPAGQEFSEIVFLTFDDTPVPCGQFMAFIRPSWGGIDSSGYDVFSSSEVNYDVRINNIDAPSTPGYYSYEVTCVLDWCDGTINDMSFNVDIEVVTNGDPTADLYVSDHDFDDDPYPVNEEVCGEIKLKNRGDTTYEIETVDLDDSSSDANLDWNDDDESTNFTLAPGDSKWIGDPFCFIPTEEGTACINVDIEIADDDWYDNVDEFCIDINAPDPCVGVSCSNTCAGDTRKHSGYCTSSSGSAVCFYATENCNTYDWTGSKEYYCYNNDRYSHRRFHDYSCRSASCTEVSSSWVNITTEDDCDSHDTSPTTIYYCADTIELRAYDSYLNYSCNESSASCTYTNVQTNNRHITDCTYGCVGSECVSCTENWNCTLWESCQADGYRYRACWDNNSCGTEEERPPEKDACPCELISVTWSDTESIETTITQLIIQTEGLCLEQTAQYRIIEYDGPLNPDDLTVDDDFILEQGENRISWTTTHDPSEWGDSEYYAQIQLDDQEIETTEHLIVIELNDACDDHGCPNKCVDDNLFSDGVAFFDGLECVCAYNESTTCTYSCNESGIDHCNPSPCTGWSCSDLCEDSTRYFNGIPTVVGSNCTCIYNGHQNCAFGCYLDDDRALCADEPCLLQTVTWDDLEIQTSDDAQFTVQTTGVCADSCATYTIKRHDWFINPDDEMANGTLCLTDELNHSLSWTPPLDSDPQEYYVQLQLDDQEIETENNLLVVPNDPCFGITCPANCDGNVHQYNGIPTASGDSCFCVYETEDCDELDTEPSTLLYCADDNKELRQFTQIQDFFCQPTDIGCDYVFDIINNEYVSTCPDKCDSGACVTCTPNWDCSEWVCDGLEMYRACWDENDCGKEDGRPLEEDVCPCTLESVTWQEDSVRDGDTAHLDINMYGDCYGKELSWELIEFDWNPGGNSPLFDLFNPDDLELTGGMTIGPFGSLTIPWFARYDNVGWPFDEYAHNEYYARVMLEGFLPMETPTMLEVGPFNDVIPDAFEFLRNHNYTPADATLNECLNDFDKSSLYACAELYAELGEYIEFQTEPVVDVLTWLVDLVAGEGWEFVLTLVCTACDTGLAEAGVIGICLTTETGVGAVACAITLVIDGVVCGGLCLEYVTNKIAVVAKGAWRWLLKDSAKIVADPGSMTLVREAADEASAFVHYQDDARRSVRVWSTQSLGESVHFAHLSNAIIDYDGGRNFLFAVNRFRNRAGRPIIKRSIEFLSSPIEETEFIATLFQDDFASNALEESFRQLSDGMDASDLFEEIEFVRFITDADGTPYTNLYGATDFRYLNEHGVNKLQIAVNPHLNIHGELARNVLVRHTLVHEIGHATINKKILAFGYQQAERTTKSRVAVEFFNDMRTLNKLDGTIQGDYYDALRTELTDLYNYQAASTDLRTGERFVQLFIDAVRNGRLNDPTTWNLIKLRAYIDEFGLPALATTMDEDLSRALARESDEVQEAARVLLEQRSIALREHGRTFIDHIDDIELNPELDHILCNEYKIVTGCQIRVSDGRTTVTEIDSLEELRELLFDDGAIDQPDQFPGNNTPNGINVPLGGCDCHSNNPLPSTTLVLVLLFSARLLRRRQR